MISYQDIAGSKVLFEKDLVADQTFTGLTVKLNTGGREFNVTEGLGTSTATSTLVLAHAGGFDDQRVTATMKYVAPSTALDHEMGVMARFQTLDENADEDYYYARVVDGEARITKVIAGSFTTLSQGAFPLPVDTDVTITFSVVGNALTAEFNAGGAPETVNLAVVDTDITQGGLCGFRTRTSAGYFSQITVEQL